MKLYVTVKPRATRERVEQVDETHVVVYVQAAPIENEANKAVIKSLARFFSVAPSCVVLRSGVASKQKVFDIIVV